MRKKKYEYKYTYLKAPDLELETLNVGCQHTIGIMPDGRILLGDQTPRDLVWLILYGPKLMKCLGIKKDNMCKYMNVFRELHQRKMSVSITD
jgi:hypothetical protein